MIECDIKNETCGGECTGYDGSHRWKNIHTEADLVECDRCRPKAQKLMVFSHDIVNAKLGKPIFDEKNFADHVKQIKCICEKTGLC